MRRNPFASGGVVRTTISRVFSPALASPLAIWQIPLITSASISAGYFPRPLSSSASARFRINSISSSFRGLRVNTFVRESKGRDHLEGRVFCGCTNEDDRPLLHVGKKGVLLGLIESMDLVDKEDGPPLSVLPLLLASPTTSLISFTPERTALKAMNWAPVVDVMAMARVVFPEPGGPHKIIEGSWSDSIA